MGTPSIEDKLIGELYVNGTHQIYQSSELGYFTISHDNGEKLDFPWEERIMYLCKPWSTVGTYQDEKGVHYMCNVYDGIYIDIWAIDIEDLLNLICNMLTPTDEIESIILDRVEKANKANATPD